MNAYQPDPPATTPRVDAARLWAGGAATALVAALTAVVGLLVVRDLLDIAVITPARGVGNTQVTVLAGYAVVAALLATALLHVLILTTPSARSFFTWICILASIVAAMWPFTMNVTLASKFASAAIYFVVGMAIVSLLSGIAGAVSNRDRAGY